MQPSRGRRWLVLWVWLAACAPDAEIVSARLELLELPSCEVGEVDRFVLRAAGDFPMQERALPRDPPYALDEFSPDARWLGIEAQAAGARAGSLTALDGHDLDARAVMLPLGRSCPLGDPLVFAPPGAAVAPLPGGGLLIAGGEVDARATSDAVVLPPGDVLARVVPGGMLLRRSGASATRVGTRVVIAGGGSAATYEVYDAELGAFDNAQIGELQADARRDHAAARLPDGRVLLVGGVAEQGGEPLASAELIDLEAGEARAVDAELARVAPAVLVLDSGTVLIALGKGAAGEPVTELERFDPERGAFELVGAELPCHSEAALATLEGDRLLYVGCRDLGCPAAGPAPNASCELGWLLPDAGGFSFTPFEVEARELDDLGSLRAVALRDGRVLVTGVGSSPGSRRAFLIDPNAAAIESDVRLSRVPAHLIALEDGMIAELDEFGASLRREELRSELDSPDPQVVPSGMLQVALDLPSRWEQDHSGLLALAPARFDLPFLRFADVRVEVEIESAVEDEGEVELLLEPEAAPAVAVVIDREQVALGGCRVVRAAGASIGVERRGESVLLRSGDRSERCSEAKLAGRVGIAISAAADTRIAALRVERL